VVIHPFRPWSSKHFVPFRFSAKFQFIFLISSMRTTCPVHLRDQIFVSVPCPTKQPQSVSVS
jgi:hypothetical protein